MNEFEKAIGAYYTPEQFAKIRQAKVGIAGAGGLGSNIAVSLVRSGFRQLELLDFDVVETKNLNRQYYFLEDIGKPKVEALAVRLLKINPDLTIAIHQLKLTAQNAGQYFQGADILFEAFDGAANKKMFLEAYGNSGKLLICGSGMAGVSNAREMKIRKIGKKIYLVGDEITSVGKEHPPLAPRVSACAGLMASVALEWILCPK